MKQECAHGSENNGCQYDTQCKDNRVCNNRQCVNQPNAINSIKNDQAEKPKIQDKSNIEPPANEGVNWSSVKIVFSDSFKDSYKIVDREILDENTVEWTVSEAKVGGFYMGVFGINAYFENKKGVSLGQVRLEQAGSGPKYSFTLKVPSRISEQWDQISKVRIGP